MRYLWVVQIIASSTIGLTNLANILENWL